MTIDVRPVPTIPIVLQEQKNEHVIVLDTPNEQPGQNALDNHHEIRRPGGWNGRDHEDQGMVVKQPSGVVPGRTSNNDQPGEGTCYGQYGGSSGECRYPGNPLSIHIYQFQEESVETQCLRLPQFLLVF